MVLYKVRFITEYNNKKIGDIANVSLETAEKGIQMGYVEYVTPEPAEPVAPTPTPNHSAAAAALATAAQIQPELDKMLLQDIEKILRKYLDLKEEYYSLMATWIIGTYLHKTFYTYPYLFFNAMKGSGKSRALKLIAELSYKGEVTMSLSEAVLVRSEPNATFCIDEFESIASKEKQALRELLNAAYKKGGIIKRNKKTTQRNPQTGRDEETYKLERFQAFRPIAMANIWGMEEVLNDRCITIVLEKSYKNQITNLLEIFDIDEEIFDLKERLVSFSVDTNTNKNNKEHIEVLQEWNRIITTLNDTTTLTTLNNTKRHHLFTKIIESNINSRFLELSFPLIITSSYFDKSEEMNESEKIIKILKEIMEDKKEEELYESKDIQLFDFISSKEECINVFKSLSELTSEFRIYLGNESDDEMKWLSTKWMGRALKRLVLIIKKRRLGRGRDVILDIEKAKIRVKSSQNVAKVAQIEEIQSEKV